MNDNRTTDLRRLLDERGVEYTTNDGEYVKETCWPYMGELMAVFAEYDNGTTRFTCDTWCFTPEQAIAATLGNGTCEIVLGEDDYGCDAMVCSKCFKKIDDACSPNYCPNCGAKVVDK